MIPFVYMLVLRGIGHGEHFAFGELGLSKKLYLAKRWWFCELVSFWRWKERGFLERSGDFERRWILVRGLLTIYLTKKFTPEAKEQTKVNNKV